MMNDPDGDLLEAYGDALSDEEYLEEQVFKAREVTHGLFEAGCCEGDGYRGRSPEYEAALNKEIDLEKEWIDAWLRARELGLELQKQRAEFDYETDYYSALEFRRGVVVDV